MSILREILRDFRRNVFVIGSAWCVAYVIVLAASVPPVPLFAVAMVLSATLAVLLAPAPREALLRRIAHRPRKTMTPDDYKRLRELETELGWEPSEPCMPAKVPATALEKPASTVAQPYECPHCRILYSVFKGSAGVFGYCVNCAGHARLDGERQGGLQ